MTALILYENANLNEIVTISYPIDYNFEGKVAYLNEGTQLSVEQLLEFLLVYSANDSAYATAMYISDSVEDFVKLMNKKAKKLNMKNTNFQNPDGLDQTNHYTTLSDLLIMSEYILKNTKIIDITNKSKFFFDNEGPVKEYMNTNLIINNGYRGLKTGWTSNAGLTFIGYKQDNDRNIITIVNKSYVDENKTSHFNDTILLYEESLINFGDNILLESTEKIYRIVNSYGSTSYSNKNNLTKFGNVNISQTINLKDINTASIEFINSFDDEIFKVSFLKSENITHYNFLMSNVISKLLLSN